MRFLHRLTGYFRSSVRYKLLAMVLSPLLIVLPVLAALVLIWGNESYDRLVRYKISSDLIIAHEYFDRVVAGVGSNVENLAVSNRIATAMHAQKPEALRKFLIAAEDANKLDFLNILDAEGHLVATSNEQTRPAGYASWRIVQDAADGRHATAIDIFSPEQLAAINEQLRERAFTPILPTPNAAPSERKDESRGMVIHSAAPIFDQDQRLLGILHGGLMLNRNLEFVDKINGIVYREGSLPLGSKGTTTLFLGDVRVATNVRLFAGERALGTRVSQQVHDTVLGNGETWLNRAFVVNDWYVSGYEPIEDSTGQRVGMLYVGFLEAPFSAAKTIALAVIVLLLIAISVIGAVLSMKWAKAIFQPLERMNQTIVAVHEGDTAARVGDVTSRDEIGRLARHFDVLLDTLQQRNAELRRWADELDRKVADRTLELRRANQNLRDAQGQLIISEKLAAIGQLTAGVAHEINNPVAVIQGNLDVAREVLGAAASPVRNEMRLIDEQVNRIRLIVTKLLQFARPVDYAGYVEPVEIAGVISDCLVLVHHLLRKGDIEVVRKDQATRKIAINRSELQQVLINLIVNAIHAMPSDGGGKLILETRDQDLGAAISVKDTGRGIAPDDLPRIFTPFFTTKRHGTGLGLSISRSLVERYGGTITAASGNSGGAEFTVWLMATPAQDGNEIAVPVSSDAADTQQAVHTQQQE
ncbi:MAG: cache domain-containing protein [Burkholderiales bacterium]|nr:cache domain-containing protein [Burkholderiales bacterium]